MISAETRSEKGTSGYYSILNLAQSTSCYNARRGEKLSMQFIHSLNKKRFLKDPLFSLMKSPKKEPQKFSSLALILTK